MEAADLKDELVQLSRQGRLAYRCALGGLGAMAAGSGAAAVGIGLHSAQVFAVGLAVAGLGACLLPISLMNLVSATDKAEKLEFPPQSPQD